jgi:hypothetical protein
LMAAIFSAPRRETFSLPTPAPLQRSGLAAPLGRSCDATEMQGQRGAPRTRRSLGVAVCTRRPTSSQAEWKKNHKAAEIRRPFTEQVARTPFPSRRFRSQRHDLAQTSRYRALCKPKKTPPGRVGLRLPSGAPPRLEMTRGGSQKQKVQRRPPPIMPP